MVAMPTAGLDLPIKALIWESADRTVWIAYNDPRYVVRRHGLADSLAANLGAVVPIIEDAARADRSP